MAAAEGPMICHGWFAAESRNVVFHEIRGYFVDVWGENAWDAPGPGTVVAAGGPIRTDRYIACRILYMNNDVRLYNDTSIYSYLVFCRFILTHSNLQQ